MLRVVFGESSQLAEFQEITDAVSSDLFRVECLRTLDRIRLNKKLSEEEYLERIALFYRFLDKVELIPIKREILSRAAQPFPIQLGTLDAIHLASAILYRERISQSLVFCSHDQALKNAARSVQFSVLG